MPETTERPLVTFAVIAYNQEQFIHTAIEGAFAQTYQPLEIILSDDCSPDCTFEIMQEMATAYDGPHRVLLNRNEPNLGLVPHVNRIFSLSSSNLIIVNAGDDISLPSRSEYMYQAWISSTNKPYLIHSSACKINQSGEEVSLVKPESWVCQNTKFDLFDLVSKQVNGIGATYAYDRRIHGFFGALPAYLKIEDRAIFFRAAALGKITYIDKPLIKYRLGGLSSPSNEEKSYFLLFGGRIKTLSWKVTSAMCMFDDLKMLDFPEKNDCIYISNKIIDLGQLEIQLSQSNKIGTLLFLPKSITLGIKYRSLKPIRHLIKYLFAPLYKHYINRSN